MLIVESFGTRELEQEIEILTPHKMKFSHGPSAMITEVPHDKAKNPLSAYKIQDWIFLGIRIKKIVNDKVDRRSGF